MIKELTEKYENIAFLCASTDWLKKFVDICYSEGILFTKTGFIEDVSHHYTLDTDIVIMD